MARGTHDRVWRLQSRKLAVPALIVALLPLAVAAQAPPAEKLPRYASLRSDEVNLRIGPGETYPIVWVFKRKDMPVEIIEQQPNAVDRVLHRSSFAFQSGRWSLLIDIVAPDE